MQLNRLFPTLVNVKSLDTLQLNFEEFMKLKDKDIIALNALEQFQYIDCGRVNELFEHKYENRLKQIKSVLVTKKVIFKSFK